MPSPAEKHKPAKIDHDKKNRAIAISFRRDFEHIGASEELSLLGCTIVLDRNRSGKICALEILY